MLKTSTLTNMHLATFVRLLTVQRNPFTKKYYAIVLLNLYGNLTAVTVPDRIVPLVKSLKSGDDLVVFLKKVHGSYFLYGIDVLKKVIYN